MGTELLRPQDCFSQRIPFISRRRNYAANNAFSYRGTRKPAPRPEQRKRLLHPKPNSDDSTLPRLLMDKVTILRRGDSLDSNLKTHPLNNQGDALLLLGTQRLGPDPEMVPKQIRITDFKPVYAGSAFAVSPSPSALPLPSFFRKQAAVHDSATRDLRRLLRLE